MTVPPCRPIRLKCPTELRCHSRCANPGELTAAQEPPFAPGMRNSGSQIVREIHYVTLRTGQGNALRAIAARQSHFSQINRVLRDIHRAYAQPIDVEALACKAGMSPATFHRHFKKITFFSRTNTSSVFASTRPECYSLTTMPAPVVSKQRLVIRAPPSSVASSSDFTGQHPVPTRGKDACWGDRIYARIKSTDSTRR